jgi:hypothetical protein
MRFFAILIGSVVVMLMAFGAIHFWGLGQVYPKYDHAFFNGDKPWIALNYSQQKALEQNPQILVWIDVFRDAQRTLVVDSAKNELTLNDTLKKWSGRRIILNLSSNDEDLDRQLAEFLPPYMKKSPILLQSEFDIVLRATKEILDDLPYGSSQSDRMRFNAFAGMAPWSGGLISATPFRGDVYVSPLKWKNISLVNKMIVDEIHRRQKYVLIGPLQTKEELRQAQSLDADGYYLQNAQLLNDLSAAH